MTATITRPCPSCTRAVHRRQHVAGYIWQCRCGWLDGRAEATPGDSIETLVKHLVDEIHPGEERLVRKAASRYYLHKLRKTYPELQWRHERVSLLGGSNGVWDVYALRPDVRESVSA